MTQKEALARIGQRWHDADAVNWVGWYPIVDPRTQRMVGVLPDPVQTPAEQRQALEYVFDGLREVYWLDTRRYDVVYAAPEDAWDDPEHGTVIATGSLGTCRAVVRELIDDALDEHMWEGDPPDLEAYSLTASWDDGGYHIRRAG